MQVSFQDLSELTGFTYRTIKKRVSSLVPEKQGKSLVFSSDEALPLIYNNGEAESEVLDLTRERARLAKEQADRLELQNAESRKQLIPAELVTTTWQQIIFAARQKFLGMPSKLSRNLHAAESVAEVSDLLKSEIYEIMNELSRPPDYRTGKKKTQNFTT